MSISLRIVFCLALVFAIRSLATAQMDSVNYARLAHEEILTGKADEFHLFDEAFYQNQLFLLGESHGVAKPQEVDLRFLTHLNKRVGVRYYIAEVDASQAYYLNQYLATGNQATLTKVFRLWVVQQAQWANKEYRHKIEAIRDLNQTLPQNRQIQFVGIDRIQDKTLVAEHLSALLGKHERSPFAQPLADSLIAQLAANRPDSVAAGTALTWLANWASNDAATTAFWGKDAEALHHLLANVVYLKAIRSREVTIFTNFKAILPSLKQEKLYGFWGFFHVLQSPLKVGVKPFACQVKESDLYLHDKIVSITFSYLDSYTMTPTRFMPPFLQDKGKAFTRVDKFNNDSDLMKSEGIATIRPITNPHSVTLFALDRPGSFARQMPIRITYGAAMPQKLEFNPALPMTSYFQYLLLVRDSDMTTPLQP
ncbi:hypothetical protein GCM10028819_44650 [Spirosoma humi]